jgi:ribosomal protein S18 acetylase RimI-like enzyme
VVELVAPTMEDVAAITRVIDAEDAHWWGQPDGDADDTRDELQRVIGACGSLEAGARMAVVDGELVGVGMLVGHGHTSVSVDPAGTAYGAALAALLGWLAEHGAVEFEVVRDDADRLALLAAMGFVPFRSSFELERSGDVADLPQPTWPVGIVPVPFRPGVDDVEVHEMLYAFWTDVPGHTYRPIDEWRQMVIGASGFDPDLVVVARADGGEGPVVGYAAGRIFTGTVGWVSQLGVAPSARGRGLGRAILLDSCHRLAATGVDVIGLGVEAENANALGLYRSVGLEIAREFVHCER